MSDPYEAGAPPPKQNGMAIASVLLGVLGMFCFGPITLIPAVILGHMALNRARREPARHDSGLAIAGLVVGYVGFVAFIFFFGIGAAIMLPALARAREAARTVSCENNLKMTSLSLRMYAGEHDQAYPPLSPETGKLMFEDLYPDYMADASVLVCPSSLNPALEPIDDHSYFYFGYMFTNERELEAFAVEYEDVVSSGGDFAGDIPVAPGTGSFGGDTALRLQLDVPSGVAATVPVLIDRPDSHSMGTVNVLFLDGHTERIELGQRWPATYEVFEMLDYLDSFGR